MNIKEMRDLIEFDDAIAYAKYIEMMNRALNEGINDDMREFDAIIEICDSHDDAILITDDFLRAHHDHSIRALNHYATIINPRDCKCDEYCAYHESCNIDFCNQK